MTSGVGPTRAAMRGSVTLCIYDDADVMPTKVSERTMEASNTERQAELLVGLLCRSVPSRIVRRFCEMTGADYTTILELGTVDTERRRGQSTKGQKQKHKLTPDQVRVIRTSSESNREEARRNHVSERVIRDVRNGKSYAWVTEKGDDDGN